MSATTLRVIEGQSMDKSKALDAALSQIERAYGKGSIMRLGKNEQPVEVATVPTGSLGLDIALGIDEAADAAGLLGLGDGMEGERRLARGFRPVNLDDPALWQTADPEGDIKTQRAG